MGTSTIRLIAVTVVLAAAAAAIGFFGGRTGVLKPSPAIADPTQTTTTSASAIRETLVLDKTAPADPRADLLRALEQPAEERNRAVRIAMNAWLTAEGAAAITAARNAPELRDVANRITQLALFAYPEIFVDHPSLLEGIPDAKRSIAMAARAIAIFDPDAARGMIDTHLSGSIYRDAMLSAIDELERAEQDPYAELESIVAGSGMGSQFRRVGQLVSRVAEEDPVAAAELIDGLPASLREYATQALVTVWSQTDPEEAARWLVEKNVQVSGQGLNDLARRWGQSDFEAANAFAETLTGRKRAVFLTGLVGATQRLSKEELLAWVSRYEGEPAYPHLMVSAVQRFAQDDVGAAIELIETLPERMQLDSYRSIVPSLAFRNPEAAVALIDEIGNESVRDELVPMVSSAWAQNDAESALDWALGLPPGPSRDRAIGSITSSLMNFGMDFEVDRAIELIETLPEQERLASYRSVVPSLAFRNPETAVALIDQIGNESVRDQLVPVVARRWAQNDAEAALDWALGLAPGRTRDQAIASISSSLMEFDVDRAVDAIDEIEGREVRKGAVWQLLFTVDSDDEAIRLGRDHGFDRDAVLELRENRGRMHGPGLLSPAINVVAAKDADPE